MLKDSVTYDLVYEFYQCYKCSTENCLGSGKYCAIDPDGDGVATGKDIVLE